MLLLATAVATLPGAAGCAESMGVKGQRELKLHQLHAPLSSARVRLRVRPGSEAHVARPGWAKALELREIEIGRQVDATVVNVAST